MQHRHLHGEVVQHRIECQALSHLVGHQPRERHRRESRQSQHALVIELIGIVFEYAVAHLQQGRAVRRRATRGRGPRARHFGRQLSDVDQQRLAASNPRRAAVRVRVRGIRRSTGRSRHGDRAVIGAAAAAGAGAGTGTGTAGEAAESELLQQRVALLFRQTLKHLNLLGCDAARHLRQREAGENERGKPADQHRPGSNSLHPRHESSKPGTYADKVTGTAD